MKFNKMNVVSFAKLQALLTCFLGFVAGLLYSFGGLVIDVMVSANLLSPAMYETSGLSYGTILAFGAVIGMPVIFALFGFVLGIIEALLYNLYVSRFGAVDIDFWQ